MCWTHTGAINNTNINVCAVDLPSKILKCWYTNADSLINKIDELKGRIKVFSPDIICVTEVFPKNCVYGISMSEIYIEGYDCFCSEFNHHDRGVCIYIRDNLNSHKLDLSRNNQFNEYIFCSLSLSDSDDIIIGVVTMYTDLLTVVNIMIQIYGIFFRKQMRMFLTTHTCLLLGILTCHI